MDYRVVLLWLNIIYILFNCNFNYFRELYYGDTILFKHSNIVRKALIDICCLLGAKSWELGITLTSSGLVAGNLKIYMSNGKILDCSNTTEGKVLNS